MENFPNLDTPIIPKIDWENLKGENLKPHERIINEAILNLKGENFDESFLQSEEIREIIEERMNNKEFGFEKWRNELKNCTNPEEKEAELANGLSIYIKEALDRNQRKAA